MKKAMIDIRCLSCGTSTHSTHEDMDSPLLLGPLLMRNNRHKAFDVADTAMIAIAIDRCNNCPIERPGSQ